MDYRPGEYVLLEDSMRQIPPRSYSIANAPRPDGLISLLITRVAAGTTSVWVHDQLRRGDEVTVTGPYGTFVADPGLHRALLVPGCRIRLGADPGADRGSARGDSTATAHPDLLGSH